MSIEENIEYTLSIQAGMKIKIAVDVNLATGKGSYFKKGEVFLNGSNKQLINGFALESDTVGNLSILDNDTEQSVVYEHLKSKENRIHFYALDGDVQVINIITIPVHDHSSINQGGPAFGTYYTDIEEEAS